MANPEGSDEAVSSRRTGLCSLERQVVNVARKDSLSSLRDARLLGKAARFLFGGSLSPRLANPRLEALRRFVVLVHWNPTAIDADEIGRMREAGYSDLQMDEARSLLGHVPSRCVRHVAILFAGTVLAGGFTIFLWMCGMLGDPMIAAVVLGVVALPLLPVLWPRTSR